MARYAARHCSTGDPVRDEAEAAFSLRDRLTREWLRYAIDGEPADVVGYDPRWWDGQSYDPCLIVRSDGHKLRVVDTGGSAVVVPFSRRQAARLLAERRKPTPSELDESLPRQREAAAPPSTIAIDAGDDAIRCSGVDCGALVALDVEICPRCGHSAGD
jgi:hypothetical protein